VTVTGAGSYTGIATGQFTIRAKAVTPTITLSKDVFTYNGKVQKPAVTVRNGQTTMAASAYTVAYGNAKSTNAGTYAVTVTMRGNNSGKATSRYQIKAKKITPKIALSKTAFTYNAKIQKPSVTVKNGNTKLAKSTYTVTYSNTKSKNVGIYKVTVKMKGYEEASKHFEVATRKTTELRVKMKRIFAPDIEITTVNGTIKRGMILEQTALGSYRIETRPGLEETISSDDVKSVRPIE
jgi:type III secretory pathway component EscV